MVSQNVANNTHLLSNIKGDSAFPTLTCHCYAKEPSKKACKKSKRLTPGSVASANSKGCPILHSC